MHGVPFNTIQKSAKNKYVSTYGGQTIFTVSQEESLVKLIQVCGNWSFPLSKLEIRMIAKRILNKEGQIVACFKENLPGIDWVISFLKRHIKYLSVRQAQNINTCRAQVHSNEFKIHFDHLTESNWLAISLHSACCNKNHKIQ